MTTTTYLELDDQATGANNNTWGDVLDANMAILEQAIARYTSIATTGGTTTLTSSQNRYPIIVVTGTLVSDATIVVRTAEKNWRFLNLTSGNYTVTVKTLAGTGKIIPRGQAVELYCDGTNVEHLRRQAIPAAQAGGTVDVITATFYPAIVSNDLQDGLMVMVEAAGANTSTTPTLNVNGTGALTITKRGGTALLADDIEGAGHKLLLCYDASSTRWELLNPAGLGTTTNQGLVRLATDAQVYLMAAANRAVSPANLALLLGKGTAVAGASSISLGAGGVFNITGSSWTATEIVFADNSLNGRAALLRFNVAGGVLTYNSAKLPLPGGANITVAAGDMLLIWQSAAGEVYCTYERADGKPVAPQWEQISQSTPSGAGTVTITDLSAYKALRLTLIDVTPSTDGQRLRLRLSSDGSSYISTNYEGRISYMTTATHSTEAGGADGFLTSTTGVGNAAGDGGVSGTILITNFNVAQQTAIFADLIFGDASGNFESNRTTIWHTGQTAMQAIRLAFDSGNISGTVILEGLR